MKTPGGVFMKVALWLLATGLPIRSLAAENGTAVPAQPDQADAVVDARAAAPSAIELARRDLEAFKALRNLGSSPKPDSPSLALPRLQPRPLPASPPALARPIPPGKTPSANWLVEAMEADRTPSDPRESGSARSGGNAAGSGDRQRDRALGPSAGAPSRAGPALDAGNPFSTYLGQWMNPQDYALLRPALEANRNSDTLSAPLGTGDVLPPALHAKDDNSFAFLTERGRSQPPPEVSRGAKSNPYLESVAPVLRSPAPVVAPATLRHLSSPPVGGASPVTSPAAPPSPGTDSPGRGPGFVRPDNDERHFKPLKRF